MAGIIGIESLFSSFTGEKQLEIDFPHDQYFRKIGTYVRLILAGILLGYSFSTSVTCYPPGGSLKGGCCCCYRPRHIPGMLSLISATLLAKGGGGNLAFGKATVGKVDVVGW